MSDVRDDNFSYYFCLISSRLQDVLSCWPEKSKESAPNRVLDRNLAYNEFIICRLAAMSIHRKTPDYVSNFQEIGKI